MSDESEFFDLVGTGKPKQLCCARCGRKPYSQVDRVILCKKCGRLWAESKLTAEHIRTWVGVGVAYQHAVRKNPKRKRTK